MNRKILVSMAALMVATGILIAVPVFAQTTSGGSQNGQGVAGAGGWHGGPGTANGNGHQPGVFGTVSAINGTSLTVQSRGFGKTATTTYTVNAAKATVNKNNAVSTIASVSVGDTVMVQGTVSGTSVTATVIRDGVGLGRGRGPAGAPGNGNGQFGTTTSPIKGNGQPVVAGTVSAINGTALTLTTSSNTSYAIDASSAVVSRGGTTSSVSAIAVGDYAIVQGAVNGTSVTASAIIDQKAGAPTNSGAPKSSQGSGFFGSIGNFFKHLFGF